MVRDNLDFKCALITGGAGGLGKAIAQYFQKLGKKVILVGRTESKLKDTVQEFGGNVPYYVLDTGKIAEIPDFIAKVVKEHPEVDCIVNNAGVQRVQDVEKFDLKSADEEININIRAPMYLAIGFLDHLKAKRGGGIVLNVSSVLGYNPVSVINPVYNGTKAWLHMWSMGLRTQLAANTDVRVIEVVPPAVGTDLHRDREDPDDNKNKKNGSMTVEGFMADFAKAMETNQDTFSAGPGVDIVQKWYHTYGPKYKQAEEKYLTTKKQ